MKSIIWTLILTLFLLSISCNKKNSEETLSSAEAMSLDAPDAIAEASADASVSSPTEIIERKLIKTGNVSFETDDLNGTRTKIVQAVNKYHGYISSDNENKSVNQITINMVIRIPTKDFDALLSEATAGITQFDDKSISVEDVTEEFVDIESRLKTKKELEARYLSLLKQAKSVKDILEIETQIGTLRSDIESIEGRLKYLQSQVSFSTLNISFYKRISESSGFGYQFKNGFINGWDNLIKFFVGLVNIWPFILIIGGLVYPYIRHKRAQKATKEKESTK